MRALLLAVTALALLAGCASLPESGRVETEPGQNPVDQAAGSFDYTPAGPRPDAPALSIVEDFLLAMQASPQSTAVARKFLTDEARGNWFPDKTTVIYGNRLVSGRKDEFKVSLEETAQLDGRGTWLGQVGEGEGVEYTLELQRERGEWRIANPPDALIIPQTHFETRYQQYFVYFFDPTGQVLVPEPTYLPRGEQAATLLVRRLLDGPHPELEGVLRTFVPGGTEYVLSVPVSPEGVAEVALSEEVLRLSAADRQMVLAQLGWTLRQVTGLEAIRVTVDGAPIDIQGAVSPHEVASWAAYDPSVPGSSQDLFGLREDQVVALRPGDEEVVGRFGAQEYSLRGFAVSLSGDRLAGISEDGSTAILAPRGQQGTPPPGPDATEVIVDDGTDLLDPAWDVQGRLWLLDRTAEGTTVQVAHDGAVRAIEAPGLDGEDLSSFVVSRDGTRLVAVVERKSEDRLLIARVRRGPGGRVQGLTRAQELPLAQDGVDEIRDLAWRSPDSLAVLTGPSPETSQVLLALVDGSTASSAVDSTAEILRRRAERIAAAPTNGAPVFLGTDDGDLYELSGDGQWIDAPVGGPLHAITFAG
jgi:Lipoprotein LpqB beta-propeller domain/Sporulation and spore germination